MSWEERRGRRYYYRKRREGQRVISEYVGTGDIAEFEAAGQARVQRALVKVRAARAESERVAKVLDELEALTEALMHATLIVEGYHSHRGEWRKKRHGKQAKPKVRSGRGRRRVHGAGEKGGQQRTDG